MSQKNNESIQRTSEASPEANREDKSGPRAERAMPLKRSKRLLGANQFFDGRTGRRTGGTEEHPPEAGRRW